MKIVRTEEAGWVDSLMRGAYGQRRKPLGGERLQCGLWELLPGKKSFPFHAHHVTEEAMFVISGTAKLRTPEGLTTISAGDYVFFSAGGADAHQLINDSTEPLRYFAVSATLGHDLVEYPDTGKLAATSGLPGSGARFVFQKDAQVDYFAGDKDA